MTLRETVDKDDRAARGISPLLHGDTQSIRRSYYTAAGKRTLLIIHEASLFLKVTGLDHPIGNKPRYRLLMAGIEVITVGKDVRFARAGA